MTETPETHPRIEERRQAVTISRELRALIEREMAFNTKFIEDGGELVPRWVAEDAHGKVYVIATPFGEESQKAMQLGMLKAFFQALEIQRYVFSSEAWISNRTLAEHAAMRGVPPAQDPKRREAITCIACQIDQPPHQALAYIERIGKRAKVAPFEIEAAATLRGRMVEMLKFERPMNEAQRAATLVMAAAIGFI